MTDVKRILFKEARMPPPKGFYEILKLTIPSKISVDRVVTIWTQPVKDLANNVECKFDVNESTLLALKFLCNGPFVFSTDPRLDPLERMATPGIGKDFCNKIIDDVGINNPEQRKKCHTILEDYILPAHENEGHIQINLSVDKSSSEYKMIWWQLMECLRNPDLSSYLDFPDHISEAMLFEHYISVAMHELYALLKEESAWKRLSEEQKKVANSAMKENIRLKQDTVVVKLLEFLIEKSGNDLAKVQKIIDELVIKRDRSLSHFLPHLLRDLARGVEIDRLLDSYLEQTYSYFSSDYSRNKIDELMDNQKSTMQDFRSTPQIKALFSTYMSLRYDESNLNISFYSQENGNFAISSIPHIVIVREAKKILDRAGILYPISPFSSMEDAWTKSIESIALGHREYRGAYQFDAIKDFSNFYRTWRPALLEAQKNILAESVGKTS